MRALSITVLLTFLCTFSTFSQWTQTAGPEGGEIRSMFKNGSTIFAGTMIGGLYRSEDDGSTWAFSGLSERSIFKIAKSSSGTIYAGTDGGLYRSINNGTTWLQIATVIPTNGSVEDIAIAGETIFVLTARGIYKSIDDGLNWTVSVQRSSSDTPTYGHLNVKDDKIFHVNDYLGVFMSDDNGVTWDHLVAAGLPATPNFEDLVVHDNLLYCAIPGSGIFYSNDGLTWTASNTGLTNNFIYTLYSNGSTLFTATGYQVFRSINDGATWTEEGRVESRSVGAFLSTGSEMLAGAMGVGIYRSADNGTTWSFSSSGLRNTNVNAVAVAGSALLAGTTRTGIYRSLDDGANWTNVLNGEINSFFIDGAKIYAASTGRVARSDDNGVTWLDKYSGMDTNQGLYVYSITKKGTKLFAATNKGIYTSVTNGDSWTLLPFGPTPRQIVVLGNYIFVATAEGLFRSGDDGANWTQIATTLPSTFILSIAAVDASLFITDGSGSLYRSQDNGNTWTLSLQAISAKTLVKAGQTLYGASYEGIFVSNDLGMTWIPANSGLSVTQQIRSLAAVGTKLFAGSAGNGVFIRDIAPSLEITGSLSPFTNQITLPSPPQSFVVRAELLATPIQMDAPTGFELSFQNTTGFASSITIATPVDGEDKLIYVRLNGNIVGDFSGNINVSAGTLVSAVTVPVSGTTTKREQVISFEALANTTYGASAIPLTATSNSGLTITYTSSDPEVAAIVSNSISILRTGETTITATQAGNDTFDPAEPVDHVLSIAKATQTITFPSISDKRSSDPDFQLSAISSSGLPIEYRSADVSVATVSGSTVTIKSIGLAVIEARQAGNENYLEAAMETQGFHVRQFQEITFGEISRKKYNDAPFTLTATSSSSLPITFTSSNLNVATIDGDVVTIVGAGSSIITAIQSGSNFVAAADNVMRTLTVDKAPQQITFSEIESVTVGGAPISLSATSSSALKVTFSTTSNKLTITDDKATLIAAGAVTIHAEQPGNNFYSAAATVSRTFCINPVTPVVTLFDDGTLSSNAATGHQWYVDGNKITGANASTYKPTQEGIYTAVVTVDGCSSAVSNGISLVITSTEAEHHTYRPLLSPNPAREKITIQLDQFTPSKRLQISIIHTSGKLVENIKTSGTESIEISLAGYAQGLYLVRIQEENVVVVQKFVKN
jgi:photosystem II stability/assembly factor-like uncharacterized protein